MPVVKASPPSSVKVWRKGMSSPMLNPSSREARKETRAVPTTKYQYFRKLGSRTVKSEREGAASVLTGYRGRGRWGMEHRR
jgi:hypothetical protein